MPSTITDGGILEVPRVSALIVPPEPLEVDKYLTLENVTLTSTIPAKKSIPVWVWIAGVVVALMIFKK